MWLILSKRGRRKAARKGCGFMDHTPHNITTRPASTPHHSVHTSLSSLDFWLCFLKSTASLSSAHHQPLTRPVPSTSSLRLLPIHSYYRLLSNHFTINSSFTPSHALPIANHHPPRTIDLFFFTCQISRKLLQVANNFFLISFQCHLQEAKPLICG